MRYFQRRLIADIQNDVRNLRGTIPYWLLNHFGRKMLNYRVLVCVTDYIHVIALTFSWKQVP